MQQLYKCFSYWQANKDKKPILLNGISVHSRFVKGFLKALQEVFGVEYVRGAVVALPQDGSGDNSTTMSEEARLLQHYQNVAVEPAPVPAYALLSPHDARELTAGILRERFGIHNPTS